MYVIEGLAGGAVAEVTKIHHACIDGVSGAEILGVLLDIVRDAPPTPAPETPWRAEREWSQWSMLGRGFAGLLSRPRVGFRLARRTVPKLGALASNFSLAVPSVRRPRELLSSPGSEGTAHTVQRHDHAASAVRLWLVAVARRQVGQAASSAGR